MYNVWVKVWDNEFPLHMWHGRGSKNGIHWMSTSNTYIHHVCLKFVRVKIQAFHALPWCDLAPSWYKRLVSFWDHPSETPILKHIGWLRSITLGSSQLRSWTWIQLYVWYGQCDSYTAGLINANTGQGWENMGFDGHPPDSAKSGGFHPMRVPQNHPSHGWPS